MKAEELRIGVYVNLKDKGIYMIDSGYDIEKISDWYGTDYCRGIPLTEEWLLKFVFEDNRLQIKKLDYLDIVWRHDKLWLSMGCAVSCLDCKYVHQLQNLYYSLTGQELILK